MAHAKLQAYKNRRYMQLLNCAHEEGFESRAVMSLK